MRDRLFSLQHLLGAVLGALLISQASLALSQTHYRVELMIFAYTPGGAAEQWEALPELVYPEGSRLLIDHRETSGIPSTPLSDQPSSLPADSNVSLMTAPEAYVLLPPSEREFGARAASMRSSGRYRILFHETWLQPVAGQAAAVPVVMDSGDGEWPELQGTVTLYQSGDAILETNLWLNTRGEYLPGTWRMPPPPRGPKIAAATQLAAVEESPDDASPVSGLAMAGLGEYPYRHAVLLQDSRRLRTGEVSYIDHPMLGVVAKISALEAPATAPAEPAEVPPPSAPTL